MTNKKYGLRILSAILVIFTLTSCKNIQQTGSQTTSASNLQTNTPIITSMASENDPPVITTPAQTSITDVSGTVGTDPVTAPITTEPTKPLPPPVPSDDSVIVRVKDYIPDVCVDLRYAGKNNEAGYAIYAYDDAYLRYGTVKKLEAVQEGLKAEGLSLLIWDAFRPIDAQRSLSVILPNRGTNPVSGTVAFNNAATVSVAVVNADGSKAPLPSDFDSDAKDSDREFGDVSAKAAANARLIDKLMLENGLVQYMQKWYRYTDSTDYPVVIDKTLNKNGLVDCESWLTECKTTVSMRKKPNSTSQVLTKLSNATTVSLCFFVDKYACVCYDGQLGYIPAINLRRNDENSFETDLTTIKVVEKYTYEQMQTDLAALAAEFSDRLSISTLGKSEQGRDLTLAILGDPNAKNKIFVSSAIHAREHMTTTFTMAQIEYMLRNQGEVFTLDGKTIGDILNDTCFVILPMTNPDGVQISQTGVVPSQFRNRYSSNYATIWKANANGVDLNGNFDAAWEQYGGGKAPTVPGYMNYKGTAPECAAESKAIADYLRANKVDLVLCYHMTGSVIYWEYGNNKSLNNQNRELALMLASTSGFALGAQGGTSTAGLKDWVIDTLKTPSLTIEFGTQECPLPYNDFSNLWGRCRDTLLTSAVWVDMNK